MLCDAKKYAFKKVRTRLKVGYQIDNTENYTCIIDKNI